MAATVFFSSRKPRKLIFASGLRSIFSSSAVAAPSHWPITVAMAAPRTPMFSVKINTGSRMMLVPAPTIREIMLRPVLPLACRNRWIMVSRKEPVQKSVTMRR